MHVMSLNLLTSRKTPLIKPRTTDGSLRFRSSFRKPKRFHLLSICANAVYNVLQLLKDISSIRFFCKDIHKTLKYVDKFSELKMTKFKKELTHLSLSLLVDLSMHFDFPERMCMYQSHSLSLFTFAKTVWIQIRPEWNSGKNVLSICDRK